MVDDPFGESHLPADRTLDERRWWEIGGEVDCAFEVLFGVGVLSVRTGGGQLVAELFDGRLVVGTLLTVGCRRFHWLSSSGSPASVLLHRGVSNAPERLVFLLICTY